MRAALKFEKVSRNHLSNSDQPAKYLTACYEERPDVFLQAFRDVVEAQGGMTRAARLAGLNRESLYRQLSRRGNPSLSSFNAVLCALGLKLRKGQRPEATLRGYAGTLSRDDSINATRIARIDTNE